MRPDRSRSLHRSARACRKHALRSGEARTETVGSARSSIANLATCFAGTCDLCLRVDKSTSGVAPELKSSNFLFEIAGGSCFGNRIVVSHWMLLSTMAKPPFMKRKHRSSGSEDVPLGVDQHLEGGVAHHRARTTSLALVSVHILSLRPQKYIYM